MSVLAHRPYVEDHEYNKEVIRGLDDSSPTRSLSMAGGSDSVEQGEEEGELTDEKFEPHELMATHCPLLTGIDVSKKREEIREYFHKTFSLYELLFTVLRDDSVFYMQPEKLRHPLIFYYAHTACFFINKLYCTGIIQHRINETIESTCAIGVDEMSWDDLNSAHYDWPTVATVRHYRHMVRTAVDDLISSLPMTLPITWESPFWIILMGCEHERIHLETSSVLFRQLEPQYVVPKPYFPINVSHAPTPQHAPVNSLLPVPGAKVQLGKDVLTSPIYGWDNEYGVHNADVAPFLASKYLVSNAEFKSFIDDGGYDNQSYWGEEGWKFVQFRQAKHPVFWVPVDRDDNGQLVFKYRSMTHVIDMPWDWPVDCNYIEAKAWCAWKNEKIKQGHGEQQLRFDSSVDKSSLPADALVRMPTEEEWQQLLDHAYPEHAPSQPTVIHDQPYWTDAPGNINLEHGASSCPVNQYPFGHGFYDVLGNAWQWTETPINAFKGFRFHPAYDDFSVPTFDTRHNLIKGGSWISTGNEATRLARYAFRRHFYQHASFRYVYGSPLDMAKLFGNACEKDHSVTQQIHAQYSELTQQPPLSLFSAQLAVPNYCVRIAKIVQDVYEQNCTTPAALNKAKRSAAIQPSSPQQQQQNQLTLLERDGVRVVDFGCACGRMLFELARLEIDKYDRASQTQQSQRKAFFEHLLGIDFSTRFIRIASLLQQRETVTYATVKEGDIELYHEMNLKEHMQLDVAQHGVNDRLEFMQSDVCNLHDKYDRFDVAVVSNLLEYLAYPTLFLQMLCTRVKSGGVVVLISNYDWDEKYTKKDEQLGGFKGRDGENKESAASIAKLLQGSFDEIHGYAEQELLMLIPHASRKYELKVGHITIWKRK